MGKIVAVISASVLFFLSISSCDRKDYVLIVEAPTSVYEDYPKGGPPTAKVISVLAEGERREIIHERWAKDTRYLKIRLNDGRTGYVGWDGKYRIVEK